MHKSTTPTLVMFERELLLPFDLRFPLIPQSTIQSPQFVADLIKQTHLSRELAYDHLRRAQCHQAHFLNAQVHGPHFQDGDEMMVNSFNSSSSMAPGPASTLWCMHTPTMFTPTQIARLSTVQSNRLKLYTARRTTPTPTHLPDPSADSLGVADEVEAPAHVGLAYGTDHH